MKTFNNYDVKNTMLLTCNQLSALYDNNSVSGAFHAKWLVIWQMIQFALHEGTCTHSTTEESR